MAMAAKCWIARSEKLEKELPVACYCTYSPVTDVKGHLTATIDCRLCGFSPPMLAVCMEFPASKLPTMEIPLRLASSHLALRNPERR